MMKWAQLIALWIAAVSLVVASCGGGSAATSSPTSAIPATGQTVTLDEPEPYPVPARVELEPAFIELFSEMTAAAIGLETSANSAMAVVASTAGHIACEAYDVGVPLEDAVDVVEGLMQTQMQESGVLSEYFDEGALLFVEENFSFFMRLSAMAAYKLCPEHEDWLVPQIADSIP